MSTDTFIVTLPSKQIVSIVGTDSNRFFKIANRKIKTDGLISNAVEISASYVAQLVARFGFKPTVKGKAFRIRRFRKEEAI
jgi:hypothetical protein